ncbi:hypothetical protein PAAG_12174 [Paracoccidioides lutzii Pb01]|uniref:Uncharacterized protein n=1 Tax=Paracoccidioides lutzii (strain ATCC MYA-826 / Pb01) TaxID=502779 RepID=A0A0A2V014_PARBA|nr:hypothetical protein PAAG_12174 [Paracoccidioides lutzii Pb01]KGQ01136.1 hypothetical protein PAAG_12174 [Paracoccidioides lutzii Pb01]
MRHTALYRDFQVATYGVVRRWGQQRQGHATHGKFITGPGKTQIYSHTARNVEDGSAPVLVDRYTQHSPAAFLSERRIKMAENPKFPGDPTT